MPYKNPICGIYMITTPNGSSYIGSSCNVKRRWAEHRSNLRRGAHHASRLQAAWEKHGTALRFEILLECDVDQLSVREQDEVVKRKPELNVSTVIGNVWSSRETRDKFAAIYSSERWRTERSSIAKRVGAARAVAVDCSNGERYNSLHAAAASFGIRPSGIAHLIKSQRQGRLGVRFKRADEPWREVMSSLEQQAATRRARGYVPSAETRKKMSDSARARCARAAEQKHAA